jgi:hypothetical protein
MMMDSVDAETAKRRKGKIPDRKKYDEEVEALMSQIGEKEAQLVRCSMTWLAGDHSPLFHERYRHCRSQ